MGQFAQDAGIFSKYGYVWWIIADGRGDGEPIQPIDEPVVGSQAREKERRT
jgi:hypothetical protein